MKVPSLWFAVQVLPYAFLAWAATALGWRLASPQAGAPAALAIAILGLLSFTALLALRARPDWLLAALLAFALLAGLGLGSAHPGEAPLFSLWPSLATVAVILISGAAAPRLGRRLWKLQRPLWALSLAFLTAWAALGWLRGGPPAPRLWAAAGTALFGGHLSAWFAGLPADGDGREHAAGFYLLTLSLILLARLAFPLA